MGTGDETLERVSGWGRASHRRGAYSRRRGTVAHPSWKKVTSRFLQDLYLSSTHGGTNAKHRGTQDSRCLGSSGEHPHVGPMIMGPGTAMGPNRGLGLLRVSQGPPSAYSRVWRGPGSIPKTRHRTGPPRPPHLADALGGGAWRVRKTGETHPSCVAIAREWTRTSICRARSFSRSSMPRHWRSDGTGSNNSHVPLEKLRGGSDSTRTSNSLAWCHPATQDALGQQLRRSTRCSSC